MRNSNDETVSAFKRVNNNSPADSNEHDVVLDHKYSNKGDSYAKKMEIIVKQKESVTPKNYKDESDYKLVKIQDDDNK